MAQVKADALSPFSRDEHDPDFDGNGDDARADPMSSVSCNESEGAAQTATYSSAKHTAEVATFSISA